MPIRVTPNEVRATPAGPFRRLEIRPRPTGLLNVPGQDPAAKRRVGMGLVDAHDGSKEIHRRVAGLLGPTRADGKLDPSALLSQWTKARNAVLKEGPRGSGLRTDIGVTAGLREVDTRFGKLAGDHLDAMRAALDGRAADFQRIPELGAGSLPPTDRAEQLRLVRERVRSDLDQLSEMADTAMRSNDRALADELCSVVHTNTVEGGLWAKPPALTRGTALADELREWFATPRTVAGAAAAALGELQAAAITGLDNELKRPDAAERVPVLLANGVFQWLMPPDADQDGADRFNELAQLAAAPQDVLQLSADGSRLVAIEAEAPGPVQWGGLDRGSRGT